MIHRTTAVVATLLVVIVAAIFFLNARSSKAVAQQELRPTQDVRPNEGLPLPVPPKASNHPLPQFRSNSGNQAFGQNRSFGQTRTNSIQIRHEAKQLLRVSYMLPEDAAETMTKLFAHKATALVECKIEVQDDKTAPGLVKLVVTAEPATQQSISKFIETVFPASNVKKYVTENIEESSENAAKIPSGFHVVKLKLPHMT